MIYKNKVFFLKRDVKTPTNPEGKVLKKKPG